jgi:hypothetical protein
LSTLSSSTGLRTGSRSVDSTDFRAAPGGILVSGISRHESITARDEHVNGGMEHGMRDTYQRLDEWIEARRNGES